MTKTTLTPDTCATCGANGYRADNADGDVVVDGAIVARVPGGETILALDEHSRWTCGPCYVASDPLLGR